MEQPQNWQNDLSSFPRQTIQHDSNLSLCPNHLCPTLCNTRDCSTLGLPVHHLLPELTQTHVHLILCRPLLLLSPIFPSIRVFSNELLLHIRWPKYWNFNFNISPSNEYSGLTDFQRIARRDKKVFFSNQCKEIEENNRKGKTRDLF